MKTRAVVIATCAVLAFSMAARVSAHGGEAETVAQNFEAAAIPNIPGKHAPGGSQKQPGVSRQSRLDSFAIAPVSIQEDRGRKGHSVIAKYIAIVMPPRERRREPAPVLAVVDIR